MKCLKPVCLTLLALTFLPALASADSGFYIGAAAGGAAVSASPRVPNVPVSFDEDDSAYKIMGGYLFDLPFMFVAVEGAWVDFGSPDIRVQGQSLSFDTTGVSVFGIAGIEVGPVDLFGKLGGIAWDIEASGFGRGFDDDGFDFGIGAGIAVGVGAFSVRGEYEYFDAGQGDFSMLSLGVTYLFD